MEINNNNAFICNELKIDLHLILLFFIIFYYFFVALKQSLIDKPTLKTSLIPDYKSSSPS
jgi:hypothetical protein